MAREKWSVANLRTASEAERQLDKLLSQKQPGVALGEH